MVGEMWWERGDEMDNGVKELVGWVGEGWGRLRWGVMAAGEQLRKVMGCIEGDWMGKGCNGKWTRRMRRIKGIKEKQEEEAKKEKVQCKGW